MVVAIDGPAGVGKSSIARFVSEKFSFFNLNSGSFYRAIALGVLDSGIDPTDDAAVIDFAGRASLDLVDGRLHLDGVDVEGRLRTDQVDRWSSPVSAIVPVRHIVNNHLRRVAEAVDLVAEGRDMTTVVFPDAEVKIFLDADAGVRARRRFDQGTSSLSVEELERTIRERDHRDRNKKEGSLKVAPGATVIDTSALTLNEVFDIVTRIIREHLQSRFQE